MGLTLVTDNDRALGDVNIESWGRVITLAAQFGGPVMKVWVIDGGTDDLPQLQDEMREIIRNPNVQQEDKALLNRILSMLSKAGSFVFVGE